MRRLYGLQVLDVTSGYRLYRAAVLRDVRYLSNTFSFLPELLIRINTAGYRIIEEPIHFIARRQGTSKLPFWLTSWSYLALFAARLSGRRLRRRRESGRSGSRYYDWRSRSGCYFCFFQRKAEWVRLADNHPDLFEAAVKIEYKAGYEHTAMQGRTYTWSQGETLRELIARRDEILRAEEEDVKRRQAVSKRLLDVLADDDEETPCLVCHL